MVEGTALEEVVGFFKSRVILSAAELDLFTRLDKERASADVLAGEMTCDRRALTRLLDCLVALRLLLKEDGMYRPTERGAILSSSHSETVLPMVLHFKGLWETWSGLTETVKAGTNPRRRDFSERSADTIRDFIGAMHVIGRTLSKEIANSYDLARFRRLLDIGGGAGTYTIAFLLKNPQMTAVLFDRPDVVALAQEKLGSEGLLSRVELVEGDFYHDELPTGCDLALMSAIVHQNNPQENLELCRKVYRALVPNGKVLIRDHVMDATRTHPLQGALFAINMLVGTRGGDTYTFDEIKSALEAAGFVYVKMVRSGERMDCLVEARKPS